MKTAVQSALGGKRVKKRLGPVGSFALALLVLVAACLTVLWFFLKDYQDSLPRGLAQQVQTACQSAEVEVLSQCGAQLPASLSSKEDFAAYYEKNGGLKELYFYPGTPAESAGLQYEFVSGKSHIATLILQKTGKKSLFGFEKYAPQSLRFYPLAEYTLTAPADVQLVVNGSPIDPRYMVQEAPSQDSFAIFENGDYKIRTYKITDFVYMKELTATAADGSECVITWSEDGRSAAVSKQVTEQQQTTLTDFATRFAKAYNVFASKRYSSRKPVMQFLYPGTPFVSALKNYSNEWSEIYEKDRYDNWQLDNFVRYSDTEFSCDIRFDYVITSAGGREKTYPFRQRLFITTRSGQPLLVDMQSL